MRSLKIQKYEILEDEFLEQIITLAKLKGWRIHHSRPGWTSKGWRTPIQGHKGFPDLILVRERTVVVEAKSASGHLSPEQCEWRDAFLGAGAEYYCWKPEDWHMVELVLAKGG